MRFPIRATEVDRRSTATWASAEQGPKGRRLGRADLLQPIAIVAVISLVAMLAVALLRGQIDARVGLEERFHTRIELTTRFAVAYNADVLAREASVGSRRLAGSSPTTVEFDAVMKDFGFITGALLDDAGRVIQIYPAREDLIGVSMIGRYEHLAAAVGGRPAISNVVMSAVEGLPVVAFAAPFDTPYGRRVLSGAFDVSTTPLSAHLHNVLPFSGGEVFLVDAAGMVVASNLSSQARSASVEDHDAGLAAARGAAPEGRYDRAGEERWYTSDPVSGSSLTIVASVPAAALYSGLNGPAQWMPWVIMLALALGSLYTVHVLFALHQSREAQLGLARIDPLTGVANRRELSRSVEGILAVARRRGESIAILMIDLDRFKGINDSYGHEAGDEVLRMVTARMRNALRTDDILGRWGGEEFLAILPATSLPQALAVGERLRRSISASPILVTTDKTVIVTASVGCAATLSEDADPVIGRADRAMYDAKRTGNSVSAAPSSYRGRLPSPGSAALDRAGPIATTA